MLMKNEERLALIKFLLLSTQILKNKRHPEIKLIYDSLQKEYVLNLRDTKTDILMTWTFDSDGKVLNDDGKRGDLTKVLIDTFIKTLSLNVYDTTLSQLNDVKFLERSL